MLLNGAMLKPDDTILLNDGDELQFGFRGVKLTFRTPNSTNSPQ